MSAYLKSFERSETTSKRYRRFSLWSQHQGKYLVRQIRNKTFPRDIARCIFEPHHRLVAYPDRSGALSLEERHGYRKLSFLHKNSHNRHLLYRIYPDTTGTVCGIVEVLQIFDFISQKLSGEATIQKEEDDVTTDHRSNRTRFLMVPGYPYFYIELTQ